MAGLSLDDVPRLRDADKMTHLPTSEEEPGRVVAGCMAGSQAWFFMGMPKKDACQNRLRPLSISFHAAATYMGFVFGVGLHARDHLGWLRANLNT